MRWEAGTLFRCLHVFDGYGCIVDRRHGAVGEKSDRAARDRCQVLGRQGSRFPPSVLAAVLEPDLEQYQQPLNAGMERRQSGEPGTVIPID